MLKGGLPTLVALDGDGNPCDSSVSKDEADFKWEWQTYGMFTGSSGDKSCLKMDRSNQLTTSESDCTTVNSNLPGFGWKFNQDGLPRGKNLCMKDVPDAHSGEKFLITDLPGGGSGDCSSNWNMDVIPPAQLQSGGRESYSACRSKLGNFACATDAGCVLAPSKKDCTALGGDWSCTAANDDPWASGEEWEHVPCCDGTVEVLKDWDNDGREYYKCMPDSPVPTPAPAACSAHKNCQGLEGDCCPTKDDVMLGCCSPSYFMLV